jgi:hypothetical protein
MEPLLTRVLLTIVLWPAAHVLYIASFLLMERRLQYDYAFLWSAIAVGFLIVAWFILVWRRHLLWTSTRWWLTVLSVPAAVLVSVLTYVGLELLWSYRGPEFSAFIGSLVGLALWPVMAVILWRETPEERRRRTLKVSCPACGYDLQGLTECRCPECGEQYTIDQLYAGQANRSLRHSGPQVPRSVP